jgi:hypothetical protein
MTPRPCWYKDGKDWRAGFVLAWSTDNEDCGEHGFSLYPVGIIEDFETHRCYSIYVNEISFSDERPGD